VSDPAGWNGLYGRADRALLSSEEWWRHSRAAPQDRSEAELRTEEPQTASPARL